MEWDLYDDRGYLVDSRPGFGLSISWRFRIECECTGP
jgi:hypothetical protein